VDLAGESTGKEALEKLDATLLEETDGKSMEKEMESVVDSVSETVPGNVAMAMPVATAASVASPAKSAARSTPGPVGTPAGSSAAADSQSSAKSTSVSGDRRGTSQAEKVSNLLRAKLAEAGSRGQQVTDPQHLMCEAHMNEVLEKIMVANSLESLDALVKSFKAACVAAKQLSQGAAKAAASLKGHINNKIRAALRKRTLEVKNQEQQEADASKKRAKVAATKIKEAAELAPPLFRLSIQDASLKMTAVSTQDADDKANFDPAVPRLLKTFDGLSDFALSAKVQLLLGNFGGSYKRQLREGRTQQPGYTKNGKEECGSFFDKLNKVFDPGATVAAADLPKSISMVTSTTWAWGYDSKLKCASVTPNGLAMWKYLAAGEIVWYLLEMRTLRSAVHTIMQKDSSGTQELLDYVTGLTRQPCCDAGTWLQRLTRHAGRWAAPLCPCRLGVRRDVLSRSACVWPAPHHDFQQRELRAALRAAHWVPQRRRQSCRQDEGGPGLHEAN